MTVPSTVAVMVPIVLVLSGCAGSDGNDNTSVLTKQALAANKGGILGLLIDDVYRPIKTGTVFLMPLGLTTTPDTLGQFEFSNLQPGTYTLKVDSKGHEGAPLSVDVVANEYKEVEFPARRTSSENGRIISLQTSVFIPCSVSSPAISYTIGCLFDSSGDSYRTGFVTNFNGTDVRWLVGEAKFGDKDNYDFILRPTTSSSIGAAYNYSLIWHADYARAVIEDGKNSTYNKNKWDHNKDLQATVFYAGQTDCTEPADSCNGFGAGVKLAMKATMLLTAFVGEPISDPRTYAVLGDDET